MSLILKGINLPSKNARDYIIIAWYETNTHGGLDLKSKFVECADIVQIPKYHGRLIDMDNSMTFHGLHKEYFEECKRKIFEAHGILEREE